MSRNRTAPQAQDELPGMGGRDWREMTAADFSVKPRAVQGALFAELDTDEQPGLFDCVTLEVR